MSRRIVLLLAIALGVGALLTAALPFTESTTWDGPFWSDEPEQSQNQQAGFRERCGPPVASAWSERPDGGNTWAVTVGTGVGSITGLCQGDARRRLAWSAGLATLATAIAIAGTRRRLTLTPGPD